MVTRADDEAIRINEKIRLWHVVLQIGSQGAPVGVAVTNNPMIADWSCTTAQIVMHKTRSVLCAKQVARAVRRQFGINHVVPVAKHSAALEVMIGYYAAQDGFQHPVAPGTPVMDFIARVNSVSIAVLLKGSDHTDNAARVRYQVYEVRCGTRVLRAMTNKFHSVEDRWRRSPPPGFVNPSVTLIGQYETEQAATEEVWGYSIAHERLWPRFPDFEYVQSILRISENGDILWVQDSTSAVRRYKTASVCIGPQVYTERQIRTLLETGEWVDGRVGARP